MPGWTHTVCVAAPALCCPGAGVFPCTDRGPSAGLSKQRPAPSLLADCPTAAIDSLGSCGTHSAGGPGGSLGSFGHHSCSQDPSGVSALASAPAPIPACSAAPPGVPLSKGRTRTPRAPVRTSAFAPLPSSAHPNATASWDQGQRSQWRWEAENASSGTGGQLHNRPFGARSGKEAEPRQI